MYGYDGMPGWVFLGAAGSMFKSGMLGIAKTSSIEYETARRIDLWRWGINQLSIKE